MPVTYREAESLRQQVFAEKEIYSSGQLNEETIGETQISLPEQRVGINFKR